MSLKKKFQNWTSALKEPNYIISNQYITPRRTCVTLLVINLFLFFLTYSGGIFGFLYDFISSGGSFGFLYNLMAPDTANEPIPIVSLYQTLVYYWAQSVPGIVRLYQGIAYFFLLYSLTLLLSDLKNYFYVFLLTWLIYSLAFGLSYILGKGWVLYFPSSALTFDTPLYWLLVYGLSLIAITTLLNVFIVFISENRARGVLTVFSVTLLIFLQYILQTL